MIRPKVNKEWTEHEFDWTLVSNKPYEAPAKGEDLIHEDNLVFGINHEIDDEEDAVE